MSFTKTWKVKKMINVGQRKKSHILNQKNRKVSAIILKCIVGLFLILFLINLVVSIYWRDKTRVYFLDVNQGDACVIRHNQNTFLMDGGGNRYLDDDNNIGSRVLFPFLLDKKIKNIDIAFVSHLHYDHIKGILELLDCIKIDKIAISYVYKSAIENKNISSENLVLLELLEKCQRNNIEIIYLKKGDCIESGKLGFICHYPYVNMPYQENENDNSLVIELISHQTHILFTGDIEGRAEQWLMNEKAHIADIDILKVPHHGSKTSSSRPFLEMVNPSVAIISVGNNRHGHPSRDVLNRYRELKIPVYLTKDYGMIEVSINKNQFIIKKYIKKDS